jgi:hypothetical protein
LFHLSDTSIQNGFETIKHHGYSDFFPAPPEWDAVEAGWSELKPILANIDLHQYIPFRPIYAHAPKSKINLRPVTLLHPVDLIIYTSLVADLTEHIELKRIPEYENRLMSFRLGSESHELYSAKPSHAEFEEQKRVRAHAQPAGYMGFADITDFYSRLYQHGSIALFVGKWAVEKHASWKSPTAGLSHSAWKSGKCGRIPSFPTAPTTTA